ncbi:hypothetical protein [Microbulbifer sediminum]|uniref:hypothetical protein n=1 Tax=Microbulbifer sediminum TaxID=2904250 RepID=UPI001F190065|nr:hypothetical protein [Microbulbifer sediminum]
MWRLVFKGVCLCTLAIALSACGGGGSGGGDNAGDPGAGETDSASGGNDSTSGSGDGSSSVGGTSLALANTEYTVSHVRGHSYSQRLYAINITGDANWELEEFNIPGITADVTSGQGSGKIVLTMDLTKVPRDLSTQRFTIKNTDTAEEVFANFTFDFQLPEFSFVNDTVEFDASHGWNDAILENTAYLNTGTNAYTTTITADIPITGSWKENSVDIDNRYQAVPLELIPSAFSEGEYSGTVTLTAMIDGESIEASFDIVVRASQHRLIAHDNGIALSSLPGKQVLEKSVLIDDSYWQGGIDWSAQTDAAWLTVKNSGITGEKLTISANPAGLATNETHIAEIILTSPDAAIENTETIYVGLWVGDTDPPAQVEIPTLPHGTVADPVKPLLYAVKDNTVDVYHLYTGELVTSHTLPFERVKSPVISSDGKTLYMLRDDNLKSIASLSLESLETNSVSYDNVPSLLRTLQYARTNGKGMLVSSYFVNSYGADTKLLMADAQSLAEISYNGEPDTIYSGALEVSGDSRVYCVTDSSSYSSDLTCLDATYSSLDNEASTEWRSAAYGGNGIDIAVNFDGSIVYHAADPGSAIYQISTDSGSSNQLFDNDRGLCCLQMGPEDLLYTLASFSNDVGANDFWILDQTGNVNGSGKISSERSWNANMLNTEVSADGNIIVTRPSNLDLLFLRTY